MTTAAPGLLSSVDTSDPRLMVGVIAGGAAVLFFVVIFAIIGCMRLCGCDKSAALREAQAKRTTPAACKDAPGARSASAPAPAPQVITIMSASANRNADMTRQN